MNESAADSSVFENATSPYSKRKADDVVQKIQELLKYNNQLFVDWFKKLEVITIYISNHIILFILTLYF